MKIAIIGCGYVGKQLAAFLKEKGHQVTATCQSLDKKLELEKSIDKVVILNPSCYEKINNLIEENQALIILVAAKNKELYREAYASLAEEVVKGAKNFAFPRTLIYTSSTSVYREQEGAIVDELSPLFEEGGSRSYLVQAEKHYLSLQNINWRVCIFRLSEIYGPGRGLKERLLNLQNKEIPGDGLKISNLIHVSDILNAISLALQSSLSGIYNLSSDDRYTRQELYKKLAEKYQLGVPIFNPSLSSFHGGNKIVSNEKIKNAGFVFEHPHI